MEHKGNLNPGGSPTGEPRRWRNEDVASKYDDFINYG